MSCIYNDKEAYIEQICKLIDKKKITHLSNTKLIADLHQTSFISDVTCMKENMLRSMVEHKELWNYI